MMKAVLMSIKPRWCEKILSGGKTVEIRKTKPKIKTPFKCYIYCTQAKKWGASFGLPAAADELLRTQNGEITLGQVPPDAWPVRSLNGKVIAEFTCYGVSHGFGFCENFEDLNSYFPGACMSLEEFNRYGNRWDVYGWNISDLKIYDHPKAIKEFTGIKEIHEGFELRQMERAPQSWCYVEELKDGT